jgi:hypothetical protein
MWDSKRVHLSQTKSKNGPYTERHLYSSHLLQSVSINYTLIASSYQQGYYSMRKFSFPDTDKSMLAAAMAYVSHGTTLTGGKWSVSHGYIACAADC